jgi:predicted nuclease of restriction endonuclease-like (RecB) superfamily
MKEGLIMGRVEVLNESSFYELVLMIESARNRAWQAVNAELVTLYWNVGKWLSEKLSEATWGSKVVENASEYLSMKRPDLGSFTKRTLYRMVEFYKTYKDDEFVTPLVTQITWTNHLIILLRAKSPEERRFYIEKCAAEHCSKRNLERLFDSSFYERRRIRIFCRTGFVRLRSSFLRKIRLRSFLVLRTKMRFRNTAHSLVRKVFCFRCLEIWRFGVLEGCRFCCATNDAALRNKRCYVAQQRGAWLRKAVGGAS